MRQRDAELHRMAAQRDEQVRTKEVLAEVVSHYIGGRVTPEAIDVAADPFIPNVYAVRVRCYDLYQHECTEEFGYLVQLKPTRKVMDEFEPVPWPPKYRC